MITQEDIDAFSIVNVTPMEYSYWVEGKITTKGETRLVENALGLVGEAGEVAEKVKKYLRDNTKVNQKEIVKELGDVLFYTTALANSPRKFVYIIYGFLIQIMMNVVQK